MSHFLCMIVSEALGALLSVVLSVGQAWLFCAIGHHPLCECVIQFIGTFWFLLVVVFGAM